MGAPLATSLFRLLLDAAPDATVIVDESATIVLANAQVANVLGWAQDELLGQPIEVLVPSRLREGHQARRTGFLEMPTIRPMGIGRNLFARHKDGHEIPVEISLSPLETDSGTLVRPQCVTSPTGCASRRSRTGCARRSSPPSLTSCARH